jgi:predicted transcriptional regulator
VIRFLKNRTAGKASLGPLALGPLEHSVLDVLWARGESNVRDVVHSLSRPLAYTTVMTTLDRLFKKGLLDRRKAERAFVYSPRLSRQQLHHQRAGEFLAGFLQGPRTSQELLISCLVDAVGQHDERLLDELERKIQLKRLELSERGKP